MEKPMPENWKPESRLAKMVNQAGFYYDPDQDIIYSTMDPWQRKFGYAYAYDVAAPVAISAIIDCEPFFFEYDGKHWMIELWKGQYGFETGAEIGVYVSKEDRPLLDNTLGNRPHDSDNSRFFDCADNSERLEMSFILKQKDQKLFERGPDKHWWLTGFRWGMLAEPEELTLDVSLTFPGSGMSTAFIAAVEKQGYEGLKVSGETVGFTFSTPKTIQPRSDPKCAVIVNAARETNENLVARFEDLKLENHDPNKLSEELADYYIFRGPEQFKNNIVTALGDVEEDLDESIQAFEGLYKQITSPFNRFWNMLVTWFKKIFG
jgi:hypothetical protein